MARSEQLLKDKVRLEEKHKSQLGRSSEAQHRAGELEKLRVEKADQGLLNDDVSALRDSRKLAEQGQQAQQEATDWARLADRTATEIRKFDKHIADAQHEERKALNRNLIAKRRALTDRIYTVAVELKGALEEANAISSEISSQLVMIGGERFVNLPASVLQTPRSFLLAYVRFHLGDGMWAAPFTPNDLKSPKDWERRFWDGIQHAIEILPGGNEATREGARQYRVLHTITGLLGLNLKRGEIISIAPEVAAEFIEAGALVAVNEGDVA